MDLIADLVKLLAGSLFAYLLYVVKSRYDKKSAIQSIDPSIIKLPISTLANINNEIRYVFEKTSAENLTIHIGENGEKSLSYVSTLFEFPKDVQELRLSVGTTRKDIKIEIDNAYNGMIKKAEIEGVFRFDYVTFNQSSLLTRLYKASNIRYSNIYILKRLRNSLGKGRDLVFFVSWTKHNDNPFSDVDEVIIELCNSKLKSLLGFYND